MLFLLKLAPAVGHITQMLAFIKKNNDFTTSIMYTQRPLFWKHDFDSWTDLFRPLCELMPGVVHAKGMCLYAQAFLTLSGPRNGMNKSNL